VYDITLAVADANGCTDTLTAPQYINIGDPDLNFSISENQTCPGAVLTFTDSSQVDTPLVTWIWDFGDGSTGTGPQVSHIYTQPGTYDVILTGIDALGCVGRDTLTQGVEVRTPPVAGMVLSDTAACPPFALQVADASQATGTFIVAWDWEMGNGQTSNFPNTLATYQTPGTYDIQLTVTDGFGCVDSTIEQIEVFGPPQANFISSETLACVGETISFADVSQGNAVIDTWVWDFGDGNTSLLQSPDHVYTQSGTYTVTLVIFDVRGCSDTLIQEDLIRVTQPTASFTLSGQPGCPGTTVTLQDATVADTLLTNWFWDFGDGNTGTGNNPSHVYQDPGLYTVSLIVSNLIGCTDTMILPNAVEIYQPPRANFNLSDSAGCAPLNVFSSDTTESNSGITQWTWWLNGQFSAGGNAAQFLLENPGLYELKMQVTDANGCQDSVTRSIEVFDNPMVNFLASDTVGCAGLVVLFADQSPGDIASWDWDFGDGNGASVQNPIHTYENDGLYDVSLIVTDDNGCQDSLTRTSYVELSRPQADFAVNYQPDCPPVLVSFAANASSSRGIAAYDWDFGDGNEGGGMETGHTYT
ncbi:MAG: PKD domain-containing protein, partial [Bacteroidota bacterium]